MFSKALVAFGLAASASAAALSVPEVPRAKASATVCNGYAELCDRSYGNITFLGAHDSPFFSSDPFALARDQEVSFTTLLDQGVRMLQGQAHSENGAIHFCHTSCALFDGGTVLAYLQSVMTWLNNNPNEVITFLFTNPDGLSIPDVWAPVFEQSGIAAVSYVPPTPNTKQSDWPTLGELIDAGTRVITFIDAGADGSDGAPVDYLLPEFTQIWEPPFDSTNSSFPCSVNRIDTSVMSKADHMYLLNHFLDIDIFSILVSDPEQASTTNGVASITADAEGCVPLSGGNRLPNFVLTDFTNLGEGLQAVTKMNGLS
ncbi:Protein-S-isoprenylcysteine O-methyltransferase [Mycena chlorophos]|uniref:Protein-S-isoprenylcysteine O-methyltransferase n=1 Tax=Mycena chlorophos TaxID=658473 RepID=A0A8H6VXL2_MYCCL|nr:Protein-S-isoprenylcysteine O-methyltransferase [Mycena chlorophos]